MRVWDIWNAFVCLFQPTVLHDEIWSGDSTLGVIFNAPTGSKMINSEYIMWYQHRFPLSSGPSLTPRYLHNSSSVFSWTCSMAYLSISILCYFTLTPFLLQFRLKYLFNLERHDTNFTEVKPAGKAKWTVKYMRTRSDGGFRQRNKNLWVRHKAALSWLGKIGNRWVSGEGRERGTEKRGVCCRAGRLE